MEAADQKLNGNGAATENASRAESSDYKEGGDVGTGTSKKTEKKKSVKKMKKEEDSKRSWEERGDEDLIGDQQGKLCMSRVFWKGSLDSQGFPTASAVEVKEIFYHSIMVLGSYGKDINGLREAIQEHYPSFSTEGVVAFEHPKQTGACPPYFIYLDHKLKEVTMYIRGLNLLHRQDYIALMNNRKGEQPFDRGYVHHGMYKPAEWSIEHVAPLLKEHLLASGGYRLNIVGHSLGAGVAAILTALIVKNPDVVGGIDTNLIHAYCFAPPRVLSLDLAIKYSSNIYSVIYQHGCGLSMEWQDDFLPRVSTSSVKRLFILTFAFTGVVVFLNWVRQTFQKKNADYPRRLYPPGKIYHFVYKEPGHQVHRPIRARVVPSAEGRFERLILSASATTDNHFVLTLCKHLKKYQWPEDMKDSWLDEVLKTRSSSQARTSEASYTHSSA